MSVWTVSGGRGRKCVCVPVCEGVGRCMDGVQGWMGRKTSVCVGASDGGGSRTDSGSGIR